MFISQRQSKGRVSGWVRDQQAQSLGFIRILCVLFWPTVCFSSLLLVFITPCNTGSHSLSQIHPRSLFLKCLQYSFKAAGEKVGPQNGVYGENPSVGHLFPWLCPLPDLQR